MKDREYIENVIARFLNGNCTEEELKELKIWIDTSRENKREYMAIKDIWDISRQPKSTTEDQLSTFYKNQYEKTQKSRKLWIRCSSAVAAVLLLGLVISVLIPLQDKKQPGNLQVISVPLGSRSKVLLADGTMVSLNSGSELKYSSNFSAENREVQLTGEGFFEVKSDTEHPFIVKTPDFDVKVTGTRFNVCTYTENNYSSTALADGNIEVLINATSQKFAVKPGEKFELDRNTRKFTMDNADIESEIAWKDGEFIFRNIPFPELIKRLERW